MKIEGTEEELRKLFRKKRRGMFRFEFPKTKFKFIKNLTKTQKTIIITSLIGVFLAMTFFAFLYFSYELSDNYINNYECKTYVKNYVLNNLNLSWQERIWFEFKPLMFLLISCLGVSWVLHGVGFKVIG